MRFSADHLGFTSAGLGMLWLKPYYDEPEDYASLADAAHKAAKRLPKGQVEVTDRGILFKCQMLAHETHFEFKTRVYTEIKNFI